MIARKLLLCAATLYFVGAPRAFALETHTYSGEGVTIDDNADASPYPSTVTVSGLLARSVVDVRVTITQLSHPVPDDVDILLMNPSGVTVSLMSDAGDEFSFTGDLIFDDDATSIIPDSTEFSDERYRPADHGEAEALPPGGIGSIETTMSALLSGDPNGDWKLFVRDDTLTNAGSIDSWSLEIDTALPSFTTLPSYGPARSARTTTLLPNGSVLLAGGDPDVAVSSCRLYHPSSNTWTDTGSMTQARTEHTATLLRNGKVLVSGGNEDLGSTFVSTNSCEIYDPNTGLWTSTASLNVARSFHTATLLQDGKVLVTGGATDGDEVAFTLSSTAELYDPDLGTWTTVGSMGITRESHTATLLPDGKVLVSGGNEVSSDALTVTAASAELYDPVTTLWSSTSSMTQARANHTATLLTNGKVLVAGGSAPNPTLASCELFDPNTGNWSSTGDMTYARTWHAATLMPDGTVMITGGSSISNEKTTEFYLPNTGTWSSGINMNADQVGHSSTLLPGGRALLVGNTSEIFTPAITSGWSPGGDAGVASRHAVGLLPDGTVLSCGGGSSNTSIYDPSTGTSSPQATMSVARTDHVLVNDHDGVLNVIGGADTYRTEYWDSNSSQWSTMANLNEARTEAAATALVNGRLLVVGGSQGTTSKLASCEVLNSEAPLGSRAWTTVGSLIVARSHLTLTSLPNGKVLAAGGLGASSELSDCELYDYVTETWTFVDPLTDARSDHTATLLEDGRVLVVGGSTSIGVLNTCEIYDPSTGQWSATGSLAIGRTLHTATLLHDGRVLVTGGSDGGDSGAMSSCELYDPLTGAWSASEPLLRGRQNHAALMLPSGDLLVIGGDDGDETAPTDLLSAEVLPINERVVAAAQPQLTSSTHNSTGELQLNGTGLLGITGASSGNSLDSPTNYPVVRIRKISNGQTATLSLGSSLFSDSSYTSGATPPFNGLVMATAYVNGIASDSKLTLLKASTSQDWDADGLADADEFLYSDSGFNPLESQPTMAAIFNDGRSQGQTAVLNDPNSYNLYQRSQFRDLRISITDFSRNPSTGEITLIHGFESTPDQDTTPFSHFSLWIEESILSTSPSGNASISIPYDSDTRFFLLQSKP